MNMPMIAQYMSPTPQTVRPGTNAAVALKMMKQFKIRHLPVTEDGRVVGIISDRDLRAIACVASLDGYDVRQIMTKDPYRVKMTASLADVSMAMSRNKYGAAIVLGKDDEVAGIFTTTDATKVLAVLLKKITSGTSAMEDVSMVLHSSTQPRWRR